MDKSGSVNGQTRSIPQNTLNVNSWSRISTQKYHGYFFPWASASVQLWRCDIRIALSAPMDQFQCCHATGNRGSFLRVLPFHQSLKLTFFPWEEKYHLPTSEHVFFKEIFIGECVWAIYEWYRNQLYKIPLWFSRTGKKMGSPSLIVI